MEQIPHLQFQWGAFLCLTLLFLLRYLESGRRRDLVLYAIAFGWNALANVHFALFSGFLVGVTLLWFSLRAREQRGRRLGAVALATGLASVPFLPFAAGYRAAERLYGFKRYMGEIEFFSGRWTDFLSSGSRNRLWGPLTASWSAPERHFFPGATATLFAAVAVVLLWRQRPAPLVREDAPPPSAGRRKWVRIADGALALFAALWVVAWMNPGLTLGPLRMRDPGRIFVFFVLAALVRLSVAFPGRGFLNLADFLRRGRLDPRAALLLALAATGILVALGANTPFYRFSCSIRGPPRAIRAFAQGSCPLHISPPCSQPGGPPC